MASGLLLIAHAWYYFPFISDDALISLRYAQRFLAGQGLTWTDGLAVEGYSNLLWILLASALGWLGLDLITAVRLLGFLGMGSTLLAIVVFARRTGTEYSLVPGITGALTVALAAPVAIWAVGGLEQPLVAALLAWALVAILPISKSCEQESMLKAAGRASVPLGLLCLTRPDGILFAVSLALAGLLLRRPRLEALRVAARLMIWPAVMTVGQQVFRLAYYGEMVPNTALVKIAPSWERFLGGLSYLWQGALALSPFSELAALYLILVVFRPSMFARAFRMRALILFTPALIWMGYLAFVGGDIFYGWRHFVPLVTILSFLMVDLTNWVLTDRLTSVKSRSLGMLVLGVLFASYVFVQFSDRRNVLAKGETWEWDGQVIGLALKRGFQNESPLLAVTAAGCLPYWSELPSVDMLGLNDYYIPRHRPKDFGRGWIGHELGDGRYVMGRRPDLVIFTGPEGTEEATFRSGREMQRLPEFAQEYSLVSFVGETPHRVESKIWVRTFSEKIGIRQFGDTALIPSYLLNSEQGTVARLNKQDQFVVDITTQQEAGITRLQLPLGRWTLLAQTSGPVQVSLRNSPYAEELNFDGSELTFTLTRDSEINVLISSNSENSVELTRLLVIRNPVN